MFCTQALDVAESHLVKTHQDRLPLQSTVMGDQWRDSHRRMTPLRWRRMAILKAHTSSCCIVTLWDKVSQTADYNTSLHLSKPEESKSPVDQQIPPHICFGWTGHNNWLTICVMHNLHNSLFCLALSSLILFSYPIICSVKVVQLSRGSTGLGFSIYGGKGSPNGDLPIRIKAVFKDGCAARDGRLKAKDIILSVNGVSFNNVTHQFAVNTLKRLTGNIEVIAQTLWYQPLYLWNVVHSHTNTVCGYFYTLLHIHPLVLLLFCIYI